MTRPRLRNQNGPDTSTRPLSRPANNQLPEQFADLFAEADKYRDGQHRAEQELNHLADPARDAEAKQADDNAAAEAIKAGNPAPERTHEAQLAKDRAQAARNLEAFPRLISDADNAIHDARYKLLEHPDQGKETAKLKAKLKADIERAQATYQAFLESEARDAWIQTQQPMRPLRNLIDPADLIHDLQRGVIPDQATGTNALANLHHALTQEN